MGIAKTTIKIAIIIAHSECLYKNKYYESKIFLPPISPSFLKLKVL